MTIALRDCVSVQRHLEIGTEEDVNIKDVLANLIGSKIELIKCKDTCPQVPPASKTAASPVGDWLVFTNLIFRIPLRK